MKPATKSFPDDAAPLRAGLALLLTLTFTASAGPSSQGESQSSANPAERFAKLLKRSPRSAVEFKELSRDATNLIQAAETKTEQLKSERKLIRETLGLCNLSPAELYGYFQEPPDLLSPRELRGVKKLAFLASRLADATSTQERAAWLADFLEVRAALLNIRRRSVPKVIGPISQWILFFQHLNMEVGKGSHPATNVLNFAPGKSDGDKSDPERSTFWTRPADIAGQDLYAGFGRAQLPSIADSICQYEGPKTSSGTTPGFEILCGSERYKIKFREFNSEPFTARVFHALGYHVDPTDYAPRVKISYDRRIFREFNLRKALKMRMTFFGIPVGSVNFQEHFDPFDFVMMAVFKDGTTATGLELKQRLFQNPCDHPEENPLNFRTEVETNLDYLVMSPANVQPADSPAESIGHWGFEGLDHERRREVRAAGLLAAWLAWYDSRFDNTQLRCVGKGDSFQLEHFFTDLGGGLGEATGVISHHGEDPNRLTWSFTRSEINRGPGRMTTPFKVVHYQTIVRTPAFRDMTVDDARWMARLIGQLTEAQLSAALIASGYDAAEARLYLEKLVHRRDKMVLDLGLNGDIPLLRSGGMNRHFSCNPSDEQFQATLPSGVVVQSPVTQRQVVNGKLVPK